MTPDKSNWRGKRPKHARRHNAREWELRRRLPDRQVQEAVLSSVPAHPFSAYRCLYNLARKLVPIDSDATASHWRDVVAVWHALAGQRAGMTLGQALAEFARRLPHARVKVGADLDRAVSGVSTAAEVVDRLTRLLGRVWFLACRTLGDWLGVSHTTAHRRLKALERAGVVRVLVPGTPSPTLREATVYYAAQAFSLSDRFPDAPALPHDLTSLASNTLPAPPAGADSPPTPGSGLPCVNPVEYQGDSPGRAATPTPLAPPEPAA